MGFSGAAFGLGCPRGVKQNGIDDFRSSNQTLLVHGDELQQRAVRSRARQQGDCFVRSVVIAGDCFVQMGVCIRHGGQISQHRGRGIRRPGRAQKFIWWLGAQRCLGGRGDGRIRIVAEMDQSFEQVSLWQWQQAARSRQSRRCGGAAGNDRLDYGIG